MKHSRVKILVFACIVLALSLPSIFPLMQKGYFPMHDDTQVARVISMTRAIQDGQFPVRSVKDLGYGFGYPLYNFYGPLPYYVGSFFSLIGYSPLDATKIMMALGMILPSLTMGFVLYSFFGFTAAVLGTVLYIFAPYHAVELYVRGAVGELWTLIFLPLVFYGFLKEKKTVYTLLVGAVGLAGVIVSHTIIGFITLLFLGMGLFLAVGKEFITKNKSFRQSIFPNICMVLLGLGFSSFFWLPAVFEMGYTNVSSQVGGGADFKDHFVCLSQFWNSLWGFGGSTKGCIDGLSFRLGKIYVFTFFLGLFFTFWKRKNKTWILSVLAIVLVIVSLFMMTEGSVWFWEHIPYFPYIQYPWRFLVFVVFGISFLGAWNFSLLKISALKQSIICAGIISVVIGVSLKLFSPQYIYDFPSTGTLTDEEIRTKYSRISDEYLPSGFKRDAEDVGLSHGTVEGLSGEVAKYFSSSTYTQWNVLVDTESRVRLGIAYFPWWSISVDKKPVQVLVEKGMPVLVLPKGEHIIEADLRSTPVQLIGNVISLVSVFLSIIYYGKKQIA
ncbi:MAG: 6-pyruvoyl-tetrahydropterin synthase-related protein [Patescibacteria group bacterium]